jgi:predicted nucleotidyltransferase
VAHRFHHTKGVAIDVVPFGGIERENGSITMPQEDTHMVVLGF